MNILKHHHPKIQYQMWHHMNHIHSIFHFCGFPAQFPTVRLLLGMAKEYINTECFLKPLSPEISHEVDAFSRSFFGSGGFR